MFCAALPARMPYRLRGERAGVVWDFDDPFRFGPVLGEMDEYLLGEGTHKRLWQVLGAHVVTHEGVEGVHFAVWRPMQSGFRLSETSTSGTGGGIRCGGAARRGCGRRSFPDWGKGRPTSMRSLDRTGCRGR